MTKKETHESPFSKRSVPRKRFTQGVPGVFLCGRPSGASRAYTKMHLMAGGQSMRSILPDCPASARLLTASSGTGQCMARHLCFDRRAVVLFAFYVYTKETGRTGWLFVQIRIRLSRAENIMTVKHTVFLMILHSFWRISPTARRRVTADAAENRCTGLQNSYEGGSV